MNTLFDGSLRRKTGSVPRPQPPAGFTLIEVLVAIMLIALGLVGFIGVLLTSIPRDRDLLLQVQAFQYLENMVEVVRFNPHVQTIAYGSKPVVTVNCASQSCNPAQMALFEVAVWKCHLAGKDSDLCADTVANNPAIAVCSRWDLSEGCYALPDGDGHVKKEGQQYSVSVRWKSSKNDGDEYSELTINAKI